MPESKRNDARRSESKYNDRSSEHKSESKSSEHKSNSNCSGDKSKQPKMSVVEELPDYIEVISSIIDENVYEPLFQSSADVFSKSLAEKMTELHSFKRIDDLLRFTKVVALFSG